MLEVGSFEDLDSIDVLEFTEEVISWDGWFDDSFSELLLVPHPVNSNIKDEHKTNNFCM